MPIVDAVAASTDGGSRSTSQRSGAEIFEELYPSLRRFAAAVADSDIDPDDVLSEALARTLQRHDLEDLDAPAAYLRRSIMNGVRNERRRLGRLRRLLPRLSSAESGADHYPSDLALLDELPATDRAVLFMADVEGTPLNVIAAELGLSDGAVRKRASRGRQRLRELVEQHEEGDVPQRPAATNFTNGESA